MIKNAILALCLAVASAAPALRGSAQKVDLQGHLVDVPSFEGAVYDPRTHDVKAACPDAAACAYGVVVDNKLHRLDDASNDAVAAAVAAAGPETSWFVKISGEKGADGHVAIGGMNAPARHNRGCTCGPCKEAFIPCNDCQGSPCEPPPTGGCSFCSDNTNRIFDSQGKVFNVEDQDLGLTAAEESTTEPATTKSGDNHLGNALNVGD